jgi:hypothetical protein
MLFGANGTGISTEANAMSTLEAVAGLQTVIIANGKTPALPGRQSMFDSSGSRPRFVFFNSFSKRAKRMRAIMRRPLNVAFRGVRIGSRFGGKAVRPLAACGKSNSFEKMTSYA